MTRKPGPRVPCPSCGRTIGTYHPNPPLPGGMVRVIPHKRVSAGAVRRHKKLDAERCEGGEVHGREEP